MDCLIKTVRSEGYFGIYRGKTPHTESYQWTLVERVHVITNELDKAQHCVLTYRIRSLNN